MNKEYYFKVCKDSVKELESYLSNLDYCKFNSLSDMTSNNSSVLFSAFLTDEEALMIKLKFPLTGFLDFNKAMGRQIIQSKL